MVYIKRVELTNFKSFGGTTSVPFLPGFTVISGPNGSGKSNILDALLFCLGLSSSKGMRAERLPDLVNHNQTSHRHTVEASVTVTFDLEGLTPEEDEDDIIITTEIDNFTEETENNIENNSEENTENNQKKTNFDITSSEWSITRKLRVTKQGTYTSNYYANGQSCTLTELHEQLNRLRIYAEGYNVVLQGDVTSIISMNSRERREIIDELAGVASFDRKIVIAKEKLDQVKEHEDRCRIVEKELTTQRDRLSQDRLKAEKYQKLRGELLQKEQWEIIMVWQKLQHQAWQLREQIEAGDRENNDLNHQLQQLNTQIQTATAELDQLNAHVKALGEEELLALQSTLANQEAEQRQQQNRHQELEKTAQQTAEQIAQTEKEVNTSQQILERFAQQRLIQTREIANLQITRDEQAQQVEKSKQDASSIADASQAWVQQQTELNRQIETLLQTLEPQRTEQARLRERENQLNRQIQEQNQLLEKLDQELHKKQANLVNIQAESGILAQQVETLTQALNAAEIDLQIQQETQKRLLSEQRDKQRRLDKLEAQAQALQESLGTYATQFILQSTIPGVCGLVAQLGRVEPRYQLALETAAGARLGQLVVEDDGVAAAAIELLKQKKAGRATFLPLNKIQAPRFAFAATLKTASGFIDYAINLIDCDSRYREVFNYVFGSTVVFEALAEARRYLGQFRIVTLEGELLETSGAMTGGSSSQQRSGLHFGTVADTTESGEIAALRDRLQDIEQILEKCNDGINRLNIEVKNLTNKVIESKQNRRENQLQIEAIQGEIKNINNQQEQVRSQQNKNTQELAIAQNRLENLETEIPKHENLLQKYRQALAELEQSQTHSQWQQMQIIIKNQENQLHEKEKEINIAKNKQQELDNQRLRLDEKIQQFQQRLEEYRSQEININQQLAIISQQLIVIAQEISQTKIGLTALEEKLATEKQERDGAETKLREKHLAKQKLEWQLQKLQETQQTRREQLVNLQTQLENQQQELPEPLPIIPDNINLEELQKEVRSLQKRVQAMEPVNMLALEEYDRTQKRLDELSEKLTTLEGERTELLLRIENFTTLRLRAFREAYDAVNHNFANIFAELSEGDGHLQLDDPEDPFNGGLNLVAHPKGKPVQRLASMSGGEKSLTALSFIFALQRYRPSPFYAFDEVDMFLDGANVERLARMIKQQAQQAQFIVVSLRRPMIESSERTIGVTQARGAYTQVLGIKLPTKNASV